MNLDYKSLLNQNFNPNSRVWIYQASRTFALSEAFDIEDMLHQFISQWKTHGTPVKGESHLLFGQFILLIADESASGVSGCSTDSSVRLIKDIEERFKTNMFDRTTLAFLINDKIQLLPMSQLQYAAENQFINGDTLYFNNLVQTKAELESGWITTINNSWLSRKIALPTPTR